MPVTPEFPRPQRVRVRLMLLITFAIILLAGLVWAYSVQRQALLNPCFVHLGGTSCYDEAGVFIGITPDEYGLRMMTERAERAEAQRNCQTLLDSAATPGATPQLLIAVSWTFLSESPVALASSSPVVYCGASFSVVSKHMAEDGKLWYEVAIDNSKTGWLMADEIRLISPDIEIPFATPPG